MEKNTIEYKKIEGFSNYLICTDGNVYKKTKKGLKKISKIKIPKVEYDGLRVNMKNDNGKIYTKILNSLIFETFKGNKTIKTKLFYIDGNFTNCSLKNLISDEELIDFYRKNNKNKL